MPEGPEVRRAVVTDLDVLVLDPPATQFCREHHNPGTLADYFGEVTAHRRVMRRATIQGEVPIPAH